MLKSEKIAKYFVTGSIDFIFNTSTIIHGELKFIPFNVINSLVTYEDAVT